MHTLTQNRLLALLAVSVLLLGGCARLQRLVGKEAPPTPGAAPTVKVDVTGVSGELAANVRAHLEITGEPCDSPDWRMRRLLGRVDAQAQRALRALGHFRGKVESHLAHEPGCWHLRVDVQPGPAVVVSSVDVRVQGEGANDPDLRAVVARLPVHRGEVLNQGRYEEAKRLLAATATAHGYLDARYARSTLVVDPARGTAAVNLVLDSGRRYRLGPLTIHQDTLDPALVRRLVHYRQGAPYQTATLTALDRALTDSGYFMLVQVRPRLDHRADGSVPVDVTLTPRPAHVFTAGAGVTTDTGPRGRLGYENRRVNAEGHRLSAQVSASLLAQELTGEYRIPLADPRTDWLSLQGGVRREETQTTSSDTYKLALRQTKMRFGSWLESRSIEASRESFTVGKRNGISTMLVPVIGWSRTVTDNGVRPTRGWRASLELSGASEALGSDATFARALVNTGWLQQLPWHDRLLLRAQAGAMAVSGFDRLPPSRRFFAGGDLSVRGYAYQALGPKDANGNVIGGEYLAVGSVEYEHPVSQNWSIAAFVDAGNAFDRSFGGDVKVGVGAGLRWRSPIGPVRLDLAHPMDNDVPVRLHLRLGPDL